MWRLLLSLLFSTSLLLSLSPCAKAEGSATLIADGLGVIRTGARSGSYPLSTGVNLNLGAHSEARVFARSQDLPLMSGPLIKTWTVIATSGHIEVEVAKNQRRGVLITDADRRGAICLGGRLVIGTFGGHTAAANIEGSSVAISKGRISELAQGSEIDFQGVDEPPIRRVLKQAQPISFPNKLWLAPAGVARIRGVSVAPVTDALEYELTLRPREAGQAEQRVVTRDPLRGFDFDLPPGTYGALLRTVSQLGIPSAASPEETLQVIGITLPAGSRVDELGRIHLASSQTVQFIHADGLVQTATGARSSRAATLPVGLFKNERTAVALHKPGSLDCAVALLVPQSLRAEVFAGPKLATWPADPVRISIRLLGDARGQNLNTLVTRVTLGNELIAVNWREEGDRLVGSVEPRSLREPDVLRVEVADQNGAQLGRDFLELISTPPAPPKLGSPLSVATR